MFNSSPFRYPWAASHFKMPCGLPHHLTTADQCDQRLFIGEQSFMFKTPDGALVPCEGLCLAEVVVTRENSPSLLNLPFLSLKYKQKSATKTMVIECKSCLDTNQTQVECGHSDKERAFVSEFCLFELFYAITELRYKYLLVIIPITLDPNSASHFVFLECEYYKLGFILK